MTCVNRKDQPLYFLRVSAFLCSGELLMKQRQRERTCYVKLFVQGTLVTLFDVD